MPEIIDRRISFNAGEISPWLDPRLDLDKYRMGCRTLQNMRPSIYGGAFGRSGTRYLGTALTPATPVRLIAFTREISTNYLLEFSHLKLRIWDAATLEPVASLSEGPWVTGTAYLAGDVVSEDGQNYQVLEAHTSGTFATDLAAGKLRLYPYQEIVTPYTAAQLDAVQFAQQNDVLFLSHPAHFPRIVTRLGSGLWGLTVLNLEWPATLGPNLSLTTITPLVDIYNAGEPAAWSAGTYAAGTKRKHNGLYYLSAVAANTTTPGSAAAVGKWIEGRWIDAAGTSPPPDYSASIYYTKGTLITFQGLTYVRTALYSGAIKGSSPANDTSSRNLWDTAATPEIDTGAGMVPAGGTIVLKSSAPVWEASHVGTQWIVGHRRDELKISFNANTQAIGYVSAPLYVLGEWTTQITATSTATFEVDILIERSLDLINWEPHYAVQSQTNDVQQLLTGNEETPVFLRLKLQNKTGSVPASLVASLTAGNPLHAGIVEILTVVSATQITAVVKTPLYRYLPTTAWEEPAWTSSFGYPRAVTLHENRLFYGGNARKPTTVWGSAIDAYGDFRVAAQEDRSVSYTLASDESSAIEWLVSQDMLVIGTSSGEWVMGARPGDEVPKLRRNTSFGSAPIQARAIADALVFVQRSRRKVREFAWSFERDGYQANDLIMLSEHLGDAEFRQIAIQRNPESVVWVVTSRGDLLSLTYERGQNVAGWARHVTDGEVESAAVVSGTGEDDHLWLVVKRSIDGSTVRYIERIEPDQVRAIKDGERDGLVFSDCAVDMLAEAGPTGDVDVTGVKNGSGVALYVPKLLYQGETLSRPHYLADGGTYALAAELPKASATLDPAGANNQIFVEAVAGGAAGNAITVEIEAASGGSTVVATVGNAITVTPNDETTFVERESVREWRAVASSADGTKLVAAVSGGRIYTSSDSGLTWTARATDREWRAVASSADGTKLVAAVYGGRIYTSGDGGLTWTARATDREWRAVASSADGTKLVAVASGVTGVAGTDQIWKSDDTGATWQICGPAAASWQAVACSSDGNTIVAGYAPTALVFISYNRGATWSESGFSAGVPLDLALTNDASLMVSVSNSGFRRSTNQGASWTRTLTSWIQSVAMSADGNVIYAGGADLHKSTDGGLTWTTIIDLDDSAYFQVACSGDGKTCVAAKLSDTLRVAKPVPSAAEVIDAINADASASALVVASHAPGSSGTGTVAAVTATNLTGGSDTPRWRLTASGFTWLAASTETYPWDIDAGDWSAVAPATGTPAILPATATVGGLEHLEGKTVSILADGMVHRPLVVEDGEITLDRPAVRAVVGLGYEMLLEPTYFETMDPQTTSKQGKKRLRNVTLQFWQSLGCQASEDGGANWRPVPFADPLAPPQVVTPLFTGIKEMTLNSGTQREISILLKQDQPLPLNVMSLGSRYNVDMT
jgi:hypothetical protein